jgi:hypothetical protein
MSTITTTYTKEALEAALLSAMRNASTEVKTPDDLNGSTIDLLKDNAIFQEMVFQAVTLAALYKDPISAVLTVVLTAFEMGMQVERSLAACPVTV